MGVDAQYGQLVSTDGTRLAFDVHGRPMIVERTRGRWTLWLAGGEGKRRPLDALVPPELDEGELQGWLADLFHECATPGAPDVRRASG